ncbi:MAG: hypothetical protein ACO273_02090 [Burkholderiales bacterium]
MIRLATALLGALLMTACATTLPVPPAVIADLAPNGKLRAGIKLQNTLLKAKGPNGEPKGVAVERVRELARRLNVPQEIMPYTSAGATAGAAKPAFPVVPA